METPASIMAAAAGLMNDSARRVYTDVKVLPYFNLAINKLCEKMEQNNISTTRRMVSNPITIPAGTTFIGYSTTPSLPPDIILIEKLWQSTAGTNQWILTLPKLVTPPDWANENNSVLVVWSWEDNGLRVNKMTVPTDVIFSYIAKIFSNIALSDINTPITYSNIDSYLKFKTAALCAMFVGEDRDRAAGLELEAQDSLDTSLGISAKGDQSIGVRRRPFRAVRRIYGTQRT